MKLNCYDLQDLIVVLDESLESNKSLISSADRKRLALFLKDIFNHINWTKEDNSVDVPLESEILERIAELKNLEAEVDDKIDLEKKIYANAMKPIVMFFIDLAKLTLSMSAVCAICYTISKIIPQEWAIWMPIPIIAILGVVYLVQMYYESWHHSHWK